METLSSLSHIYALTETGPVASNPKSDARDPESAPERYREDVSKSAQVHAYQCSVLSPAISPWLQELDQSGGCPDDVLHA